VTAGDARVLAECLAGSVQPGVGPFAARADLGDVDRDGDLTVVDLVWLMAYLSGRIDSF
jgi:hypothetical protein